MCPVSSVTTSVSEYFLFLQKKKRERKKVHSALFKIIHTFHKFVRLIKMTVPSA